MAPNGTSWQSRAYVHSWMRYKNWKIFWTRVTCQKCSTLSTPFRGNWTCRKMSSLPIFLLLTLNTQTEPSCTNKALRNWPRASCPLTAKRCWKYIAKSETAWRFKPVSRCPCTSTNTTSHCGPRQTWWPRSIIKKARQPSWWAPPPSSRREKKPRTPW